MCRMLHAVGLSHERQWMHHNRFGRQWRYHNECTRLLHRRRDESAIDIMPFDLFNATDTLKARTLDTNK